MENRVQKFRKAKGLSQKQLAEIVGTSQQQIQRIENNLITAKLEMAIKLAHALDKPLNTVFPGSGKALKAVEAGLNTSQYFPEDEWSDLREAGIEGDPRTWFFKVQLRGHNTPLQFQIPASEQSRLYSNVQNERNNPGGMAFTVFDTNSRRIALNLSEVMYCQFLFERGDIVTKDEEESYEAEVFFCGTPEPLKLLLEPEFRDPDDLDDMGQCSHIFYMADMETEAADTYRITDVDGDDTFIRIGAVALLSVPLVVVEPMDYVDTEDPE